MDSETIFINLRENENLIKLEIKDKQKIFQDLYNIEHSLTGRIDAQICNTFIQEAVQLIINSIVLFEKGYFDCAYYSLRQSLEISTTMVFLMELDKDKREEELTNWKNKSKFPMYGEMVKFLIKNGQNFSDMKDKMGNYFNDLQQVKRHLNKYIHKQGFNTFYVSKNHLLNRNSDATVFVDEFNNFINKCIGAIAVFRLAIDPFPVLLMDNEIYVRTWDTITEPFTQDFVDTYIGKSNIESYKHTEVYKGYYKTIILEEERTPVIVDIIKFQYIDKEKSDEILKQIHLLSKIDMCSVAISLFSEKVAKVYCYDGLIFYFTSTKTVRTNHSFKSIDIKNVRESDENLNVQYDEAFLTHINVLGEDFVIEHNEKFNEVEINTLIDLFR